MEEQKVIQPGMLKQLMTAMAQPDKYRLVAAAEHCYQISQTGTPEQIEAEARSLGALAEELQTRYGIRALVFRPESRQADILYYAGLVHKAINLKADQTARTREGHFKTVEEADAWLRAQDRIKVLRMNVKTHTGGGFGVHALEIDDIWFQWEQLEAPTGFRYGFCSEQSTKVFAQGDMEAYAADWKARNPQLRYVCGLKRTASGSLIGGIGYWKFNNERYFVLYSWNDSDFRK